MEKANSIFKENMDLYMKHVKNTREKVVCYLDILGFKNKVENNLENAALLPFVMMIQAKEAETDIRYYSFSDCMYLTCEKNKINTLIKVVSFIQYNLLMCSPMLIDKVNGDGKCKIENVNLIRGAITFGEVVEFDDFNAFGNAINKGYLLESKEAIYPRIIIDDELYSYFKDRNDIIKDDDEKYYVDFIKQMGKEIDNNKDNIFMIYEYIDNYLKENQDAIEKYEWFNSYINKAYNF